MWFLDTGYLIALFSPRDTFHAKALQLQGLAQREQRVLATTDAVLFEVGAAFAKTGFRAVGIALIDTLLGDPQIRIHTITQELRSRAIELFAQRPDKEWSLCDCLSFVVMHDNAIEAALTPDHHFAQAGFTALMLS